MGLPIPHAGVGQVESGGTNDVLVGGGTGVRSGTDLQVKVGVVVYGNLNFATRFDWARLTPADGQACLEVQVILAGWVWVCVRVSCWPWRTCLTVGLPSWIPVVSSV